MFLFKEGSARELLSQLYVIFIRIQGSISFVVDKENAILTLFSSYKLMNYPQPVLSAKMTQI